MAQPTLLGQSVKTTIPGLNTPLYHPWPKETKKKKKRGEKHGPGGSQVATTNQEHWGVAA